MRAHSLHTGARWMKFNLVGGIGIGVQLGVLMLLNAVFRLNYMLATAFAVETAVVHNFIWHERFTWAERNHRNCRAAIARFMRFNVTTGVVSIGGNLLLMRLLVGQAHLHPLLANLASIAACSVLNFVVSDKWVFAGSGHTLHRARSARAGLATSA